MSGVLMTQTYTCVNTHGRGLVPEVLDLLRELLEDRSELHALDDVAGLVGKLFRGAAYGGCKQFVWRQRI